MAVDDELVATLEQAEAVIDKLNQHMDDLLRERKYIDPSHLQKARNLVREFETYFSLMFGLDHHDVMSSSRFYAKGELPKKYIH